MTRLFPHIRYNNFYIKSSYKFITYVKRKKRLTLQAVSVSAGACGRRGVLGSDDRGKCALLLDGSRHHVGWGEGEDAGGAAAVGGQAGR